MKLIVFSVLDRGVGAFMQPFFCRSRGEAIRSFMDACSDGKTNFCRHPEDFALFQVASFDDARGEFSVLQDSGKVITALECVGKEGVRGNGGTPDMGAPDLSGSVSDPPF